MSSNAIYFIVFFGTLALSLLAMLMIKLAYSRYSKVQASSGLTGAQVAQKILDYNGITDVSIHPVAGNLTDHYDPTNKTLMLSEENYHGQSVAALGIAAHECGHAIQHQQLYAPLQWRMAAVGITNIASQSLHWIWIISLAGYFLHIRFPFHIILPLMALAFFIIMLFQLVTLPVEFDATARAKKVVAQIGAIAPGEETSGMNKVLDAAALTYVAAFISALAQFLYYLWRAQNSRD